MSWAKGGTRVREKQLRLELLRKRFVTDSRMSFHMRENRRWVRPTVPGIRRLSCWYRQGKSKKCIWIRHALSSLTECLASFYCHSWGGIWFRKLERRVCVSLEIGKITC